MFHVGPEGRWINPDDLERVAMEENPSLELEAFADHPSQRDSGKIVAHFVFHGAASDV